MKQAGERRAQQSTHAQDNLNKMAASERDPNNQKAEDQEEDLW